jgi:hypothetical protein
VLHLLFLGVLLGLRHACEPDHLVAVSTMLDRTPRVAGAIRTGVAWGVGHSAAIFAVGGAMLVLDLELPEAVHRAMDAGAGVMLIVLGVGALVRCPHPGARGGDRRPVLGMVLMTTALAVPFARSPARFARARLVVTRVAAALGIGLGAHIAIRALS